MLQRGKQLHITVANRAGRLAEVMDKLAEARVNLQAICAWVEGGTGHMMLVPDDPDQACQVLADVVDHCEMQEALCLKLPNEVGALGPSARKLADAAIDVRLIYATAGNGQVLVVAQTSDDAKAASLL